MPKVISKRLKRIGYQLREFQQVVLVVKNPPVNAGGLRDAGSICGLGWSPGGGHGNPLQYSCLENLMDRRIWHVTVHGIAKSWIQLKRQHTHQLRDDDEQWAKDSGTCQNPGNCIRLSKKKRMTSEQAYFLLVNNEELLISAWLDLW